VKFNRGDKAKQYRNMAQKVSSGRRLYFYWILIYWI